MNIINWLDSNTPGFSCLSPDERDAIMHFSLLWSFFEAKALHNHACSKKILALTHEWQSTDRLAIEPFSKSLKYFQNRYFRGGEKTHYFDGLELRKNDSPSLVEAVLIGENKDVADSIAALLIIIYRLRNNLFHGTK